MQHINYNNSILFCLTSNRGGNTLIQIITDSAADLPPKIINKYNIHVVPLTVNIDGNEYIDGVDLSPQEFYKKMAAAKNP
jgi:fatty acid-binding protein DegV